MTAKFTLKEENFCQGVANGMTQTGAYRAAYNAEKMATKTIHEKASGLMAKDKIKARVAELRAELSEKCLWTREKSVLGLIDAFDVAKAHGHSACMTGAIKELNNMHGFNVPKQVEVKAGVIEVVRATRPD